jgi:hypothetical protein
MFLVRERSFSGLERDLIRETADYNAIYDLQQGSRGVALGKNAFFCRKYLYSL